MYFIPVNFFFILTAVWKTCACDNQQLRVNIRMMHAQWSALIESPSLVFFRPGKIILALLRCSLQSLGEYLKRPDQSASGQFHQHLNTPPFLREPVYLSFPFSRSFSLLPSAFPDLPTKQLPALWIFLRRRAAGYRGKRDVREGTSGLESFQKCWLKREALKKRAPIMCSIPKDILQRSFRR